MKTFCVIPWYSHEINLVNGNESVCCWIEGNISRSELQEKFLSGQKPDECKKCWQSEENGIESRRQMENRFLDFKMDRDIEFIKDDVRNGLAVPNIYQIFLGSTCNGTCVTCGPRASSSWRALIKNIISIRQENSHADHHFEQFIQSTDWVKAKRFNLLGGEPLLIDRSFEILRKLLDIGNTDCRVSFVTNGSVTLSDSQIRLINQFSDISCCVSIDGLGKVFEYIRYPLSWNTMFDNINRYREIFSEVIVSFTVSNLNYHERPNIIRWFQDNGLLYIENYVSNPPWFNFQVIPGHELWPKFCEEIKRQDALKGINIGDFIPKIYEQMQQQL